VGSECNEVISGSSARHLMVPLRRSPRPTQIAATLSVLSGERTVLKQHAGVTQMLAKLFALTITLFLVVPVQAADNAPGEEAIKSILMKPKSWTLYYEHTDSSTPTNNATKMRFAYFEREGKLRGRHVVEFGGCDFEVSLRSDGFSFPWCPPLGGEPSLTYDSDDSQYPFKNREPRKIWLEANDQ
jgi:hypothetical protein